MSMSFSNADDLVAAEGCQLGCTDWVDMSQSRIDLFADATGDHQWIHVDPERAKSGPFGACIAHGYLTLSLANLFLPQLLRTERLKMAINIGCDRARFPAPVRASDRLRGHGEIVRVERIKDAVQAVVRITIEIEGGERPACVVDTVSRYYFEP